MGVGVADVDKRTEMALASKDEALTVSSKLRTISSGGLPPVKRILYVKSRGATLSVVKVFTCVDVVIATRATLVISCTAEASRRRKALVLAVYKVVTALTEFKSAVDKVTVMTELSAVLFTPPVSLTESVVTVAADDG